MATDSQRAPRVVQRDGFEVVEAGDGNGVLQELGADVHTACLPAIDLTAQHGEIEEKAWISARTTAPARRCRPALSSTGPERY